MCNELFICILLLLTGELLKKIPNLVYKVIQFFKGKTSTERHPNISERYLVLEKNCKGSLNCKIEIVPYFALHYCSLHCLLIQSASHVCYVLVTPRSFCSWRKQYFAHILLPVPDRKYRFRRHCSFCRIKAGYLFTPNFIIWDFILIRIDNETIKLYTNYIVILFQIKSVKYLLLQKWIGGSETLQWRQLFWDTPTSYFFLCLWNC